MRIIRFRQNSYSNRISNHNMQRRNALKQSSPRNQSPPSHNQSLNPNNRNPSLLRKNSFKTKSHIFNQESLKKSFLINDEDYNSMIYEWRKNATAPIVKVYTQTQDEQFDRRSGKFLIRKVVTIEQIKYRLTEISQVSIGESLYILKQMIDGHEAIFKKLGATSISLDKCGLNQDGELKVWINNHFDRNDMSGQILSAEDRIVEKIFEIIDLLTDKKLKNFKHYVIHNIQLNNWSFNLMKNMIKSYVKSLRIQLPIKIILIEQVQTSDVMKSYSHHRPNSFMDLKKCESEKINAKSSMIIINEKNHKKNISNATVQSMKKSMSTKYGDSAHEMKSSQKGLGNQKKVLNLIPSLNAILANSSSLYSNVERLSLPEATASEETSQGKRTQRLNSKDLLKIREQYNFSFEPKIDSVSTRKSEKQSLTSTQNQTNADSRFVRLKNSWLDKQNYQNNMSKKSQVRTKRYSYENNFNGTFGKSMQERPLFTQFKEDMESYDNSSVDSPNRKILQSKSKKIFQMLIHKDVGLSTYLQSGSEKVMKEKQTPTLQDEFNELMGINKQKQVLENNCWTKRLQGLLNMSEGQLKESINYESDDSQGLLREIKLSKLGRWGREVQKSVIPE